MFGYRNISEEIDKHEKSVYKKLDVIEKNILGEEGLALQKNTKQLFESWKPIRDEVIELMNSGKNKEAIDITQGKGAKHVLKLESSALELYNYAQTKAIGFKNKSVSSFEKIEIISILISILLLLILIFIAYYVIGRISHFIYKNEHLKNVLSVIRDVNQLIVREKNPQKMIQESCDILTSTQVYAQAWIVTHNDDGKTEYFAAADIENIDMFKDKIKSGWTPYCIQKTENKKKLYSFVEDTLSECSSCPLADLYDGKSAFNIQLKYNDKVYGYLTLSLDKEYITDYDELLLLDEVAGDIAYALYNIKIEEQLIAKEERYRFVIEGTQDGLWDFNIVNNTVYYSARWKEMLGYSDNELENSFKTWEELINPADKEQALVDIQTSQKSRTGLYSNIHRLKHKDGHWVWISTRGKTIFNENGEAVRMIGSHTDITEQKEIEIALVKSQQRYESAEKLGKVGSWEQDFTHETLNWSYEVYEIFEIDHVIEMTFDHFIQRVHPQDRTLVSDTFAKSVKERTIYNLAHRLLFSDGRVKYVIERAEYYYDENSKHVRTVGTVQDVTIEELSKKELAISNDKFEKAFNKTPNIIIISNFKTGKIYEINETGEHILGYHKEELIGKTTLDINLWNDYNDRKKYIDTLNENGSIEGDIYSFNKKNGDVIVASVFANIITIDGEEYILAVADDITKQKHMEEKIIANEKILSLIIDKSPIGICTVDLHGNFVSTNPTYESMLGYSKKELTNLSFFDVTHPDYRPKNKGLFKKMFALEESGFSMEKVYIRKDGKEIDVHVHAVGVSDETGAIKFGTAFVEDITEKKHALELLKQKKNELETIIQEAPNPIMLHNEDGKVLLVNKVWQELTGYSYDEINTIEKWTEKAYGEEMPTVKKYIDKLYELHHAVNEGEYPIITSNGETISWQFSSAPLGIIDGKRTVISSAMDITELKKKDEMMINQSRQAAMGDMIAMIAHQWRQPLTVIAMEANNIKLDIALGEEIPTEELEEMANTISEQTQQLSQTIDDFRNFFKPNQEKKQTTVGSVLEGTLKIVGKSLENNNIAVTIENKSETEFLTYSNQLLQVFLNLLGNAKDILLDKEVSDAKITIKINETQDSIITTICDNGGGIPEDAIKRLGEPYFTTKEKNGTGLGLYMSITIVAKHLNGSLTWENRDEGACFIVTLPKE